MKYFIGTTSCRLNKYKKVFGIKLPKWLSKPETEEKIISLSILGDDGRQYYAISKEFDLKEAWNFYIINDGIKEYFYRENILKELFNHLCYLDKWDDRHRVFTYNNIKWLLDKYGTTEMDIILSMSEFIGYGKYLETQNGTKNNGISFEIYYYIDYFELLLSESDFFKKLFKEYDKFDLYEKLKEKELHHKKIWPVVDGVSHHIKISGIESLPNYPKLCYGKDALHKAEWLKKLYDFLQTI